MIWYIKNRLFRKRFVPVISVIGHRLDDYTGNYGQGL